MLRRVYALLILALLLVATAPALAGGWAVVTLDSLPGEVRAGEPLTVGFTVRQHGQTPTNGVSPTLQATNAASGEQISAAATQDGEVGHFVVTVVFPSEGEWAWSITPSPFPQETAFAPLTVLPAVAATAERAEASPAGLPTAALLRWTAVALLAGAAVLAVLGARQRKVTRVPAAAD